MKIIYTFWPPENTELKTWKANWDSAVSHYCSWIASVHQARYFYDRVELYTNSVGKEMLFDYLQLPFTAVHITLNTTPVTNKLWKYGKVLTYSLQQEPYCHIDSDVILYGKLPERKILVQGYDSSSNIQSAYTDPMQKMMEHLELPIQLKGTIDKPFNFGIFGGSNIGVLAFCSHSIVQGVTDNADFFEKEPSKYLSVIEQGWGTLLLKEQKVAFVPASKNIYTHAMDQKTGQSGQKFRKHLKNWVKNQWPVYYNRIKG